MTARSQQGPESTERPAVDPRIWKRRVAVMREQGRKRLRIVMGVLAVCAMAGGGVAALHSSLFAARHLKVVGAIHTPVAEVLALSGLSSRPPLVDINAAQAIAHIDALPWVKSAAVSEQWPDSVTVVVRERSAIAAVESGSSGRSSWVLVDGTGRVLADQASLPAGMLALSVPVPPGLPGSDLPAADQPGIEIASSLPAMLVARVRSVDVAAGDAVTLGLTGGLTAVIGAPVDLEAKYEALASVVAAAPVQSGEVVDVSVPDEPTVGPLTAPSVGPSTSKGIS